MGCFFQNEDVRLEKLREKQGAARAELVEQWECEQEKHLVHTWLLLLFHLSNPALQRVFYPTTVG
jgi:hypothetical protein